MPVRPLHPVGPRGRAGAAGRPLLLRVRESWRQTWVPPSRSSAAARNTSASPVASRDETTKESFPPLGFSPARCYCCIIESEIAALAQRSNWGEVFAELKGSVAGKRGDRAVWPFPSFLREDQKCRANSCPRRPCLARYQPRILGRAQMRIFRRPNTLGAKCLSH